MQQIILFLYLHAPHLSIRLTNDFLSPRLNSQKTVQPFFENSSHFEGLLTMKTISSIGSRPPSLVTTTSSLSATIRSQPFWFWVGGFFLLFSVVGGGNSWKILRLFFFWAGGVLLQYILTKIPNSHCDRHKSPTVWFITQKTATWWYRIPTETDTTMPQLSSQPFANSLGGVRRKSGRSRLQHQT